MSIISVRNRTITVPVGVPRVDWPFGIEVSIHQHPVTHGRLTLGEAAQILIDLGLTTFTVHSLGAFHYLVADGGEGLKYTVFYNDAPAQPAEQEGGEE